MESRLESKKGARQGKEEEEGEGGRGGRGGEGRGTPRVGDGDHGLVVRKGGRRRVWENAAHKTCLCVTSSAPAGRAEAKGG